uniref:10E8 EPITOPE SCAFFOLD B055 n=1 Tax=synthetic construct TaxID=32630 RepID=UPI0032D6DBAC
ETGNVSQEDIIRALAEPLIDDGMVEKEFADHVIEREKQTPTGLQAEPVGVAIPHTMGEYVRENAISVGILTKPVNFTGWYQSEEPVPVRVVFMLAIRNWFDITNVLNWIKRVIQDRDFMRRLLTMNDEEIYEEIYKKIKQAPNLTGIHFTKKYVRHLNGSGGSGLNDIFEAQKIEWHEGSGGHHHHHH